MQLLLEYPNTTYALIAIGALVVFILGGFVGIFAFLKIYRSLCKSLKTHDNPTAYVTPEPETVESKPTLRDTVASDEDLCTDDEDLEIHKFANCARSKNANFQPRRKKWPRRK